MNKLALFVAVTVLFFVVAQTIYGVRRTRWPALGADIDGRCGVVVSNWPFDLWVTINTKSLDELDAREWIGDWRWNVRFYDGKAK